MPKRYKLTDGDKAVFRKAAETRNPNWFFNYYLRSSFSGWYWRPVRQRDVEKLEIPEFRQQAQALKEGYEKIADVWQKLGQPEFFAPVGGVWKTLTEEQYREQVEGLEKHYRAIYELNAVDPIFHHNHGTIMLAWQMDMHYAPQFLRVVCGGYGSAKTLGSIMSMLYHAATLRGYRGFALAPNSDQVSEFQKIALQIIEGTLYQERFLEGAPTRPRPTIKVGHDHIGLSTIECIPIAEDPAKVRTVTGDEAVVDQSEMVTELDMLIREVGTRFRGMMHGRPKVGRLTLLANSGENDMLWSKFDDAQREPEDIWAFSPPTPLNKYLSVQDMLRYEKYIGDDAESRRMYIFGERPLSGGKHFSAETLRKMRDNERAAIIKSRSTEPVTGLSEREQDPTEGFVWREDPKFGCWYFETPRVADRVYLTASDAGWNNPPKRDSAVVGVFDYTDFPYSPAKLVALSWVFGNHSPDPFIAEHTAMTLKYGSIGMNAFDATAQQAGYDRFFDNLMPTPVNMGGNRKWVLLNLLKTFCSRGLIVAPNVGALFSQLARYDIPDDNLVQDMVAMLMVATHLLEPMWYAVYGDNSPDESRSDPERLGDTTDRYSRPLSPRYTGHVR